MRFPAKKKWHSLPPSGCLGTPLPLPQSVRTDGRADVRMYGRTDGRSRDYYVTTKISRIDRLPYFLSNGAPLAGFAPRLRYKHEILLTLNFKPPNMTNEFSCMNKIQKEIKVKRQVKGDSVEKFWLYITL